jgi:fimbrial chaperone protein
MIKALALVMAFLCALPASAANLLVSPLRVTLVPGQTSAVLTLSNRGDKPVVLQLEAVSWAQKNGEDVYAPTRDLVASPPVFTVPPGGIQLVRMGLRRPADFDSEHSYRLLFQEVPGAVPDGGGNAVRVVLKLSIPVFMQPKTVLHKQDWRAERLADGRIRLQVSNGGNTHIQYTKLNLYAAGSDKPMVVEANMAYVLAGQAREWLLTPADKLAAGVTALHLKGGSDAGAVDIDVPLSTP